MGEVGGLSSGLTVRPVKVTGKRVLFGKSVRTGVTVWELRMALLPCTQVLQVSSQQLPLQSCLQSGAPASLSCDILAMDTLSGMACCIWAQCDSLSTAGMSGSAQAPRSGAIANARVMSTSSSFCSLSMCLYRVCLYGIFNQEALVVVRKRVWYARLRQQNLCNSLSSQQKLV